MGMFDKILIKCPNCKETLEFQSKGGECVLDKFTWKNVPWDVILPVSGEIIKCPKCLKNIKLKVENLPRRPKIKLSVTRTKESNSGEITF